MRIQAQTTRESQNAEATSPTVSKEAVIISAVIDAYEKRDMEVVDIPGAYTGANKDNDVSIVFHGTMAELMVAYDPRLYRKYISYGKKVEALLYVRIQKALYGFLKSALFFYEKMVGDLEAHRFEINPYEPCAANKTVVGNQLTITWHVNNLKIFHVGRKVVSDTIVWMESIYREMHSTCGKRHEYLGIWMD